MKKLIVIVLSIFIITGCNSKNKTDEYAHEMDNCTNAMCGYWKLYKTEKYVDDKVENSTLEIGDTYLKITNNAYETVKYKKGETSKYFKKASHFDNEKLVVDNVTYSYQKFESEMSLSHIEDNKNIKQYYQKIDKKDYPQFVFSENENELIYKSGPVVECSGGLCGYWKINRITRLCPTIENEENVDINYYTIDQYLKFNGTMFERVNYNSNDDFSINVQNYFIKGIYIYFHDSPIIKGNLNNYENLIYSLENDKLLLEYVVVDKNIDDICIYSHIYEKIDAKDYPTLNIYKK